MTSRTAMLSVPKQRNGQYVGVPKLVPLGYLHSNIFMQIASSCFSKPIWNDSHVIENTPIW